MIYKFENCTFIISFHDYIFLFVILNEITWQIIFICFQIHATQIIKEQMNNKKKKTHDNKIDIILMRYNKLCFSL